MSMEALCELFSQSSKITIIADYMFESEDRFSDIYNKTMHNERFQRLCYFKKIQKKHVSKD